MSYNSHAGVVIYESILLLIVIAILFRAYWFVTSRVYEAVSIKGTILASPLIAPGVLIHEISHLIACTLFIRKVTSIKFFTFDQSTGELGHVAYAHPEGRTFKTTLFDFVIGLAPILGGGISLYFVTYLFLDKSAFNYVVGGIYEAALTTSPYQKEFWVSNLEVYWNVIKSETLTPNVIAWLVMIVSISHGLMPSTQDLKLSLPMVIILIILGMAALLISPEHTVEYGYMFVALLASFMTALLTLGIPILIVFIMTRLLMFTLYILAALGIDVGKKKNGAIGY